MQGQRGDVSGAGGVWMVGAWEAYGCVDVGGHSLPGQRMASHTPSRFTALTPAKLASLIKRE